DRRRAPGQPDGGVPPARRGGQRAGRARQHQRGARVMPKLTLVLDRKTVNVYDLEGPVIQVGRAPGLEIVINNASVSRQPAEIRREGDGWVVRDIGSSNGTFVNGERLNADRALRPGDEISFGQFLLFFERDLATARAGAPAAAPAPAPAETA